MPSFLPNVNVTCNASRPPAGPECNFNLERMARALCQQGYEQLRYTLAACYHSS